MPGREPSPRRLDGLALGSGMAFLVMAAWVLVVGLTGATFDAGHGWFLPVVLLVLGGGGLVASVVRRRP